MPQENPLSHVVDHPALDLPFWKAPYSVEIELPHVLGFQMTRLMVMELLAAVAIAAILIPLARHASKNFVTRGRFFNIFEAIVMFLRDQVARPAIGDHGADAYVPYLGTLFFFILFCNLMGLIPGGASATGNLNVTAALAVSTLAVVVGSGMREMGVAGFFVGIVPHLDVPGWIKPALWGLMFVIELLGLLIKHFVLAMRLFANMLAGHIVLTVVLSFVLMAGKWIAVVAPVSIAGVVALSLLELFVAFLQAYIFTFLSALFIGLVLHPH